MATIGLIFDGIDFVVTMIYLRKGLKVYSEIKNKISFINVVRKYDTTGTVKVLNQTKKICENVNDVARLNTKKPPKKTSHSNIGMKRLYSYIMDTLEARHMRQVEKRERKQIKFKDRLDRHHKAKYDKKDKEDELVLCSEGHIRCIHCKHYTTPEKLLLDLAQKAGEKAVILQFAPDKVLLLKSLIMMPDKHKVTKVSDFDEFKKVFYYLQISCRECKVVFDKLWKPEDIVELQGKRASQGELTLADAYDFVK